MKPSRAEIAKAYKKIPELVIQDLETTCHGNNTSFVAGDPHATSYNEGMRSVYNRIKYFMQVDPKTLEEVPRG